MSEERESIGFVGLGRMGIPMAGRLIAAGFDVVGFDVDPAARAEVERFGAASVARLADVVERASLLVLMLPDSNVVDSVMSDEELGATLKPGTLVIDMSSSEPLRTRALADRLSPRGVSMIDAPVSGGVSGAERGSLTIMVGGTNDDTERARPALEHLGRVVRAGDVGAGHAVKALNNLMSATHLWVTSEAMVAAERFGIDPEVMLAIVNGSSGRSGSTENKWPNFILPQTYNSGFGLRLMLKDMNIAVQLAEQSGAPSVLGAAAVELWGRAAVELAPTADHTEVARWIRERSEHVAG